MSAIANLRRSVERRLVTRFARRIRALPGDFAPTVSFTFDDFPRSAVTAGLPLLQAAGMPATWYASAGLFGQDSSVGPIATAADVAVLHAVGQEIGNHGFEHLDAHRASAALYAANIARNQDALTAITGVPARTFAFPYGRATIGAKRAAAAALASSRGTQSGIARGSVDLAMLPACALYARSGALAAIEALIADTRAHGGWLILYTHDVADRPSAWGVTPDLLAATIAAVRAAGLAVRTIGDVTASLADAA